MRDDDAGPPSRCGEHPNDLAVKKIGPDPDTRREPASVRSVVTWGAAGSLPDTPQLVEAMATMVDAPIPAMQGFSEYMRPRTAKRTPA